MKQSHKSLGFAIMLGALPLVAHAQDCTPAHQFTTVTPGVLSVAAYELPPFISVKDSGFGGIDSEIVRYIAEKECLKIQTFAVDPAAVIQYVTSGQADIAVGNWYRTAARAQVLDLSAPMYLDQMGLISRDGFTKASELEGKRIGTVQGYLWTADVQNAFGGNVTVYPNTVNMAQDLANGRIDVATESYVVGVEAQKKGAYKDMKVTIIEPDPRIKASEAPGQSNLPHTKGNTALGAALDADIQELQKSGRMGEILKSFGLDPSGANTGEPRLIE